MKIIISVVLMLLSSPAIFSQIDKEKKLTYNFSLDTTIKPDYYNIELVVAEYVKYEGIGRKSVAVLVPLDTVSQHLIAELDRLGFNGLSRKTSITERNNSNGERVSFNGKPLFQVMYQWSVSSRDSVNYLFKEISKKELVAFIVTPQSYNSTLARVKERLFAKGLNDSQGYAQRVAESNNYKIINQSNIGLAFWTKGTKFQTSHNADSQPRDFVIDLSDIEIEYSSYYIYTYEDK